MNLWVESSFVKFPANVSVTACFLTHFRIFVTSFQIFNSNLRFKPGSRWLIVKVAAKAATKSHNQILEIGFSGYVTQFRTSNALFPFLTCAWFLKALIVWIKLNFPTHFVKEKIILVFLTKF